ncbi:hypothetical protein J437_LFUL012079, partial [Ladona fulva]
MPYYAGFPGIPNLGDIGQLKSYFFSGGGGGGDGGGMYRGLAEMGGRALLKSFGSYRMRNRILGGKEIHGSIPNVRAHPAWTVFR